MSHVTAGVVKANEAAGGARWRGTAGRMPRVETARSSTPTGTFFTGK
jgi:hypothetical protein